MKLQPGCRVAALSLVALIVALTGTVPPARAATPAPTPSARASARPRTADIATLAPDLLNAMSPLDGIATGGQPTPQHLRRLAEAGYRTVLDLRTPMEPRGYDERGTARRLGLEYVNLPILPATLGERDFAEFLRLMAAPNRRPVLVHCTVGSRVGALMIPYLILERRKTPAEAVRLAQRMGLVSEDMKSRALAFAAKRGAARAR